jgi:hypothetical protein
LRAAAMQTIVPAMNQNTAAAGWVVQLTIPGVLIIRPEGAKWRPAENSAPTYQFFDVAIASADKAIEAARKLAGASDEAVMRVVRALSASEIDAIKLRAGDIKPA